MRNEFLARRVLFIDLETRSAADIRKTGAEGYARHPSTEITLIAFAIGLGPVQLWDASTGDPIPQDLLDAMANPRMLLCAHNHAFDAGVLAASPLGFPAVSSYRWRDTMNQARYAGLPGSLEDAAKRARVPFLKQLDGKALISTFCKPRKLRNGTLQFTQPSEKPEEWRRFREYAIGDVEAMRALFLALPQLPPHEIEYARDVAEITTPPRGIPADLELATLIRDRGEQLTEAARARFEALTGIDKPASPRFAREWAADQLGEQVADMAGLDNRKRRGTLPPAVAEALAARDAATKSSLSKAQSLLDSAIETPGGHVVAGGLVYCGAPGTQRMAGRGVQPQNVPRPTVGDAEVDAFIERARRGDPVPSDMAGITAEIDAAASALRRMFAIDRGLIWADFAGIELRVAALVADAFARREDIHIPPEGDLLNAIRNGADLYVPSGVAIAHRLADLASSEEERAELLAVTPENAKAGGWRQMGKTAILSCIAEGELVLVHPGELIPIEQVTPAHRVWDGIEWVACDGAIYMGEKEVIEYDGLRATPDHMVWTTDYRKVSFGDAAGLGLGLAKTGEDCRTHGPIGTVPVYDILNAGPRHRFTVSGRLVSNCQYQTGAARLAQAVETNTGRILTGEQAAAVVTTYREMHPQIAGIWGWLERSIVKTLHDGKPRGLLGFFSYHRVEDGSRYHIEMRKASGSVLTYRDAHVAETVTPYGTPKRQFAFVKAVSTKPNGVVEERVFGGQLFEHVVSSISRDLLHHALRNARAQGFDVRLAVHDELVAVATTDDPAAEAERLAAAMCELPEWAKGWPIEAEANHGRAWGK